VATREAGWQCKCKDSHYNHKSNTLGHFMSSLAKGHMNTKKEYSIDRKDKEDLENKIEAFQRETKTRRTVLLTMVTTFGVKANSYSDIVQKTVVLDDLF